jgi:hypothetical protein
VGCELGNDFRGLDMKAILAQLKADINAGLTGDKVPGFDPATAPLGTDEEAAGAPTSEAAAQHARTAQRRPARERRVPSEESIAPDANPRKAMPAAGTWLGVGAGVAIVLTGFIWTLMTG